MVGVAATSLSDQPTGGDQSINAQAHRHIGTARNNLFIPGKGRATDRYRLIPLQQFHPLRRACLDLRHFALDNLRLFHDLHADAPTEGLCQSFSFRHLQREDL